MLKNYLLNTVGKQRLFLELGTFMIHDTIKSHFAEQGVAVRCQLQHLL